MSKQKKGDRNARRGYRQQFLSGFEPIVQSGNKDSNSTTVKPTEDAPAIVKGKRCYHVSIPLIIEQASNDSSQYTYKIRLNANNNIPVTPYSLSSKKAIGQASNLPKTKGGKPYSFSMVYGVHKGSMRSLSHTSEYPILEVSSQLYSFILESIDRAIQCTILEPTNQATDDDTGERVQSTLPPKSIRANKKTRRGKKVLPQVLPETPPEEATDVVEDDREILGGYKGYSEDGRDGIRGHTDHGEGLEDILERNETPDIGF